MKRSKLLWILLVLIAVLGIALYILRTEGFQTQDCSSLYAAKYDGTNTVQSFLDAPVPNDLSLTGRYIPGTGGSVLTDMTAYQKQRFAIDQVAIVLDYLERRVSPCGDQIVLEILHKYAQQNALSRFDLYQSQTAFITVQQMSLVVSSALSVKTCTRNDPRWPAIEAWIVQTNDIYTRYYNGEQLDIDKYCSPTVQYKGTFIPLADAKKDTRITFRRTYAQNNHQLMKLILNLMVAALTKNTTGIQAVVNELLTHIEYNKQVDLPLVDNSKDGGTYNFQCGFIASESARYSMILHYNSYYMMFLWTIFYILRAVSTSSKDYLQPFYKFKHDISLILRNLTDPSSVKTTATPETAGQIYINKYKDRYMSLVQYDLTKPPPNTTQPIMELITSNQASTHLKNFAYFFGTMDTTIPITTCDMRSKPVSLAGTTPMPDVNLTNSSTSSKILVESISV